MSATSSSFVRYLSIIKWCGYAREPFGYLIWGIHNKTHEFVGTSFVYDRDVEDGNSEPFKHYLARNVKPSIYLDFDEELMDGKRIVLLTIPAARTFPTSYQGERYVRIGSSKENVRKHPEAEAELFRVLNYGPPTLLNTPSRFNKGRHLKGFIGGGLSQ